MDKIPHVALLIETSKAFGRRLLRGVARYISHYGPWVTWIEERSLDDPLPGWLRRWKGDGILARTRSRKTLHRIVHLGIPVVNLGEQPLEGVPMVDIDGGRIGQLAAEHLLEHGFRHFGYVGIRGVCWSDKRRDAFVQHVTAAGGTCSVCEPTTWCRLHTDWEREREKLAHWLQSLPRPVGIMACYDVMGCRLLGVCRELGLAVPEEVAVIGVDNDVVLCEVADPPLSSVNQGEERAGYEGAALLDRIIRGEPFPQTVLLEPKEVVPRQSTDVVAVEDPDVQMALRMIRLQACKGLRVEDIAESLALSRRTLERRFQKLLGRSPYGEILRIRLQRVKYLLAETDWPLRRIAGETAFESETYLAVVFKKKFGMTPGEYRRQYQPFSRFGSLSG